MGGMLSRSVSMLGAGKTCLRDYLAKACHPRLTRVCSWESSQPPGTDRRWSWRTGFDSSRSCLGKLLAISC
jgi:hypothetical protein